jgi:hypothetical protein
VRKTTVGQLLINQALPEDMRDYQRVIDKKGLNSLLRQLAEKHPERYREVSKRLSDIGRHAATDFGGFSFGLDSLQKSEVGKRYKKEIWGRVKRILDNDDLTPAQRREMVIRATGRDQQKQIDEIYAEAVKNKNPIAMQVLSGSRGNPMNLASLLGSDLLYTDHRDETLPLPVLSSYSEGLKPVEYWAATYGARRGTLATKFAVRDAGFLSKQLNQVTHRLAVVDEDDPNGSPDRGLPVDTDDVDNEGSLLARDAGPYKRNTVLTPKILKHLRQTGNDRILVRSPLVGGSPDGGIYARDVGVREKGTLPGRGELVGLTAAQALSEPLSQGQLSAKHSGGVAGQEKAVGGFAAINQLIQTPQRFKGGAAHSLHDGQVSAIEPAPAGGHFVWVDDKKHYVPSSVSPTVKKGDSVEAGDVLSDGFPNPSIVVEHKGVGEGKRYFVGAFAKAMRDAGMKVHRRNVELLARGLINHVTLTDEFGDHVPDDVVPYSTMEHLYEPREGHELVEPRRAAGKYLERPVLHYSIGTKVRPSVLKDLSHFGINEVAVHAEPPPFKATMIRGMTSLQHDPDWMTRMYGSGLKSSLSDATHHGAISDEEGTSFVPGLARAVDFGRIGTIRQPEPGAKPPAEGVPFGPAKAISASGIFKKAGEPQVDSTVRPNVGSSNASAVGPVKSPTGQFTQEHQYDPSRPSWVLGPSLPSGLAPQEPLRPVAPRTQAAGGQPAPAGQVHPGRVASGRGLMTEQDDPASLSAFVAGGADPETPEQGFGGEFGAVSRFGSLVDADAVGTLTGGPGTPQGGYHDDLIGGSDQSDGLDRSILGASPLAAPAAMKPQPPAQQTPPPQPTAGANMQNPNALFEEMAKVRGWKPGHPDFDAAMAGQPANTPLPDVYRSIADSYRKEFLYGKQGYTPGAEKFEGLRKQLAAKRVEQFGGNVDTALAELESVLAERQAINPSAPEIAEIQQELKMVRDFKDRGVSDDEVNSHLNHAMTPEGDMTDLQLLQQLRGDNTAGSVAQRVLDSPLTAPVALKATGQALRYAGRGASALTGIGAGSLAKQTGQQVLKRGGSVLSKLVPGAGLVFEGIEAAKYSPDEVRARMAEKLNIQGTPKEIGGYLLDNALNPGVNVRGAAITLEDAAKLYSDGAQQARSGDAGTAAQKLAMIDYLEAASRRRRLGPEEQQNLQRFRSELAEIDAKNKPGVMARVVGGKDAGQEFNRMIQARANTARDTAKRARVTLGEAAAGRVVDGTATPFDLDAFDEYLEQQRRTGAQPTGPIAEAAAIRQKAIAAKAKADPFPLFQPAKPATLHEILSSPPTVPSTVQPPDLGIVPTQPLVPGPTPFDPFRRQ